MKQMATVAQTADGLEVSGNNFKVNALCGCPDMVLFACERIEQLEKAVRVLSSEPHESVVSRIYAETFPKEIEAQEQAIKNTPQK